MKNDHDVDSLTGEHADWCWCLDAISDHIIENDVVTGRFIHSPWCWCMPVEVDDFLVEDDPWD